ncbi:MAG TPA: flagellar hook capping FlgD N-terminal domain-containing protein [Candidatus Saccharimonadales bacterium]|nr:flagellar hook capping FlgD N-terminal domain-containing protein [Candidatus Saccharimonadales bacterium]
MSIYPVAAATPNASTATTSTSSSSKDMTAMFMKLLTTELKSQDPTQSMDPTTMVTQMVQINQLNEVAGIYSLLQNQASASTAATGQSVHNTSGGK